MDKAHFDYARFDYSRFDVFDPKFDEGMDVFEKQSACHLGNCAPAVVGSPGARVAGTLPDGSTLHCRVSVKIPRFDERMERAKHG